MGLRLQALGLVVNLQDFGIRVFAAGCLCGFWGMD